MHIGRNSVQCRELAQHDVAVRRERIPKACAISRFGSDDDLLNARASALNRFAKRFVELRVRGLRVGRGDQ